jgi:threonine dehydrogenase-like Zn-dependent dehydrogenase
MRAMMYRGPGRLGVEEKEIPAIEHPNDAIVRVTCAADLWLTHVRNRVSRQAPTNSAVLSPDGRRPESC